jgi:adenine-specific DNA-methyltransferase
MEGIKKLATGTPKAQWNGKKLHTSSSNGSVSLPFMQLGYEGKRSEYEILQTQPALIKTLWQGGAGKEDVQAPNHLYYGDNFPILASLLQEPSIRGKVQLIYIDPPFATNSVFQSRAQGDAYHDLLVGAHYIEYLRERLLLLRELLAEDGSIYVHLDENMAFHIKVIMDEVFGGKNFRNWITRKKCNPKNYTRKTFGNISDFILFYTKSESYVWNRPLEGWTEEHALKEYDYVEKETGRRYKKVPVHAPGTRNGETGMLWRGKLPPPGKHWQFPPRTLDEMDARGEIYWSPNGNPRRKIYLDASGGVPVQDIWLEFRDAHNQNIEITGYPTEKNPALLARIIESSSNPGDLVLDCFAGSGTTLAVASQLNRRWIGIDNSVEAISTILRRFAKGLEPMGDFVNKQETQGKSIQKPLLWESSEALTEEVEGDKLASENGNHMINNFSLKSIESSAGDLGDVLEQWLAWQR